MKGIRSWMLLLPIVLSFILHISELNKWPYGQHTWRKVVTLSYAHNFYANGYPVGQPHIDDVRVGECGYFPQEFAYASWAVGKLYNLTGERPWVSRVFNFLFSVLGIIGLYQLVLILFQRKLLAYLAAWSYTFSPILFYYGFEALPDMVYLAFSIWGLYFFIRWFNQHTWLNIALSAAAFTLAGLGKPSFLVPGGYAAFLFLRHLVLTKNPFSDKWYQVIVCYAAMVVLIGLWYVPLFTAEAGVGNVYGGNMAAWSEVSFSLVMYYLFEHHLASGLPEFYIGYISFVGFLLGLFFAIKKWSLKDIRTGGLLAWLILLFIYFFLHLHWIADVHDYYMIPFIPVFFIVVAYGMEWLYLRYRVVALVLLIAIPVLTMVRLGGRYDNSFEAYNPDLLTYNKELRAATPKGEMILLGVEKGQGTGLFLLNRKGVTLIGDSLGKDRNHLEGYAINYLYSDSRVLEQSPDLKPFLGKHLKTIGSYRIYQLEKPAEGARQHCPNN